MICLLATTSGCSPSALYPLGGAVAGASAGGIAGPAAAAGGAALGWTLGKGGQLMTDNRNLADTVDAMTKGDVAGMVSAGMKSQKGLIDEVYYLMKLALVGVVLWNLIPILYTRYVHKEHKKVKDDGKT